MAFQVRTIAQHEVAQFSAAPHFIHLDSFADKRLASLIDIRNFENYLVWMRRRACRMDNLPVLAVGLVEREAATVGIHLRPFVRPFSERLEAELVAVERRARLDVADEDHDAVQRNRHRLAQGVWF